MTAESKALRRFAQKLAKALNKHKRDLPEPMQFAFMAAALALIDVVSEMQDEEFAALAEQEQAQ